MDTKVTYKVLDLDSTSKLRCDLLMPNKMQCPTHARVHLTNVHSKSPKHICVYHFNQLKAENNGLTFVPAEN
jgi:hypothetical protein